MTNVISDKEFKEGQKEMSTFDMDTSRLSQQPYAMATDGRMFFCEQDIMNAPDDAVFQKVNINNGVEITEWTRPVKGNLYATGSALQSVDADIDGVLVVMACQDLESIQGSAKSIHADFSSVKSIEVVADVVSADNCRYVEDIRGEIENVSADNTDCSDITESSSYGRRR